MQFGLPFSLLQELGSGGHGYGCQHVCIHLQGSLHMRARR